MTIERVRELLGAEISDMTDKQVNDLLDSVTKICSVLLEVAIHDIVEANSASNIRYEENSHNLCSRERSIANR